MPRLRFKGFTDDWEQRKFGEFAQRQSETRMSDNEVPCVEYEDVIAEQGVLNKNIRAKENNKTGIVFSEDDVLYGKLRPYLHNWLNPDFKGVAVGDWWVLKPQDMDKNFLYRLLQTPQFDDAANQSTGTKMPRADWKLISNLEFRIPGSIEEQAKLGKHFNNLDNLITLHQRKCDELQKVKKYMLRKMFPKKGEKVPEIRFAGFTGDWEQRKLGDCANFRRGSFPQPYGNREWYDGEGAMPFVQVADVANDMRLVDDTKQKISQLAQPMSVYVEKGSVLVTLQGSIGRVAITQYDAFVDRTVLIFDKYNEDIDKVFWAYIIKEKFIEEAKKAPGGTIKTITKEVLADFDLILPSYEEQKRLGKYLSKLDRLISIHQSKCDALKELKKGFLQKMFI
ncbi:MAG: restriction endonuclease subunit S [Selenomonas sp.]|uniref:restriction endonuclease subunit S n=1 Tax=Selenomonas sp. TaxID=2053611 RepID=UPI0025EC33CF|nr:restriction endonuclease subunit S [Selenomonas sp.]MCR5438010.1 restriction endonuclease subunit S [Selenomonas sp.]